MVKTKIKNPERVISFLLCLVILFTVTIHAPVHKPKAFVITGTSAVIIALIVACGVDLAINNFDELQAISNDFWDWMTDKTDYPGLEDTVNVMANNMTNIYDPITGRYVNSKFKVGTQEYMDMHEAVQAWANENIINGTVNIDGEETYSIIKDTIIHTPGYSSSSDNTSWNGYYVEPNTLYSINYNRSPTNYGYHTFQIDISDLGDNTYSLITNSKRVNEYSGEETIFPTQTRYVNNVLGLIYIKIATRPNSQPFYQTKFLSTSGFSYYNASYTDNIDDLYSIYLTESVIIKKNFGAPPLFIPTNKYEWPFEIKERWHNDNVNNPEGTGEKEFTVNLEKPLENLKPEKVLPKDLTDGLTFPSVANPGIEGTLGRILEGIQSFIDGIQTKITDGILDAVDWLDGMPDIPRFAVQITLIPILLIVFLLSILLLLLRIGLFVGYLINAPVSTIGINADVLLGINKILHFDLGHASNNLNGVEVIDVITIVIYILFALSVFSIAKRFEVYRSGALWSKDDSDKWTDKNDPSKIIPAKPKTARF